MDLSRVARGAPWAVVILAAASLLAAGHAQESPATPPTRMTLEQARQTVNLLNDLYIAAVLGVHGTYVKDRATPAAAVVARQLFGAMKQKGWPETRWLSTTGRPFNPDANPKDPFEKDAVAALKSGQARVEKIVDGKLRVVTLVPLV